MDKQIRRALSQHLTGTSRNYRGAICIADPYVTTIQKYVRRFLSKMLIVKTRDCRHQKQIALVRRIESTPRIDDGDWGASTIAILILRRRYVTTSCTPPYGIVHDSRMIDLLVRNFRDKIGDVSVRYKTLNDTPSYTSHQHDVECQRRGFSFTCLGHVPELDLITTHPYLPSTYPMPHMIHSFSHTLRPV